MNSWGLSPLFPHSRDSQRRQTGTEPHTCSVASSNATAAAGAAPFFAHAFYMVLGSRSDPFCRGASFKVADASSASLFRVGHRSSLLRFIEPSAVIAIGSLIFQRCFFVRRRIKGLRNTQCRYLLTIFEFLLRFANEVLVPRVCSFSKNLNLCSRFN